VVLYREWAEGPWSESIASLKLGGTRLEEEPVRPNRCDANLGLIDDALADYERDAPALAASPDFANVRP
jgi:hypothetical protein